MSPRPTTRNKAFQGAYQKGVRARGEGKPKVSPYGDNCTWYGGVTFSRAFDRYWCEGWEDADQELKEN